jgi:hypothetical protein
LTWVYALVNATAGAASPRDFSVHSAVKSNTTFASLTLTIYALPLTNREILRGIAISVEGKQSLSGIRGVIPAAQISREKPLREGRPVRMPPHAAVLFSL